MYYKRLKKITDTEMVQKVSFVVPTKTNHTLTKQDKLLKSYRFHRRDTAHNQSRHKHCQRTSH